MVFSTGQHLEMAHQALSMFGLVSRPATEIGQPANGPTSLLAAGVAELGAEIGVGEFDWVLVQGDTTSALAGALAGMAQRAGRSHSRPGFVQATSTTRSPRSTTAKAITAVARLHFGPPPEAQAHLLHEGVARGRCAGGGQYRDWRFGGCVNVLTAPGWTTWGFRRTVRSFC
ncbi:MAG: UDP-N-acetylglucosamine 2-epimerase [Candidatus Microthrix sp.]|nr:UDP-N-acetylglucosamine 2-epimerase [Candidatus Microthrix sp.]